MDGGLAKQREELQLSAGGVLGPKGSLYSSWRGCNGWVEVEKNSNGLSELQASAVVEWCAGLVVRGVCVCV